MEKPEDALAPVVDQIILANGLDRTDFVRPDDGFSIADYVPLRQTLLFGVMIIEAYSDNV